MMPCIFYSYMLLYMLQPLTFVCGYGTLWFTLLRVYNVIISILTLQSCLMMVFIRLLHVSFITSLQLMMICCRLLHSQLR
ncbi:hypothetical protein F4604DRAFT_1796600 [Suillus subluteus]|nr:hypothetical protein F4604DRAFT_1796600 [Suillus subluteus]